MIWLMRLSIALSLILLTVYGGLNLFSSAVDTIDMAIGLGFAIGLSACLPSLVRKFTVSRVKYAIEDLHIIPIGEQLKTSQEQQLDLAVELAQTRVARDELANDNQRLEREVDTLTGQTTRLSKELGYKEDEKQQLNQEISKKENIITQYVSTIEENNKQLAFQERQLKELTQQKEEVEALYEGKLNEKEQKIEKLKLMLNQKKSTPTTDDQEIEKKHMLSSPRLR